MAWLLYVSLKVVFISDCMVTLPSEFQSVKMCCVSVSDDLFVFIDGELRLEVRICFGGLRYDTKRKTGEDIEGVKQVNQMFYKCLP